MTKLVPNTELQNIEKGVSQNVLALNAQTQAENEKIEQKRKEAAQHFIRVGDDYYKIVYRPDKMGKLIKDYLKTSKTTITDDFTRGILKYIKKYHDFVIVPSHTNYQQEINGFFNQYSQLTHQPEEGSFCTILSVLKHVFGENHLNFALDYLQLLYITPQQRLPILLLESQAKNTGKSTFANLVYSIFQDNAIKIGNNDLQSDFNSVWISRLVIIIDETQLEKNGVTQMLKRYSTETGKVTLNEKNKKQREVDFFGKFIFLSNEEGKALRIEKNDPRWAVFKVKTFAESGIIDDPMIEEKLKAEIPSFLHFLTHRSLFYPHKSRMYFDPAVYQTEQLQLYYNNAASQYAKAVKRLVCETFDLFPHQNTIGFSVREIMEELKSEFRQINREPLIKAIEEELNIKQKKRSRYTYCSRSMAEIDDNYFTTNDRNNTHFEFSRELAESWKYTMYNF